MGKQVIYIFTHDSIGLAETVEQFERSLIADALERHAGNVGQTAKALHIPKTTLVDKIRKHGLGR
jgi:two-component system C4-dicarboxylate transport response regulator DctD